MNRRTTSAIRFAVAALLVLAWGLALLPAAQAQTSGGNLIGRVQDKSNGGALPGVTVTATQKGTGLTSNTVTVCVCALVTPPLAPTDTTHNLIPASPAASRVNSTANCSCTSPSRNRRSSPSPSISRRCP